METSLPIEAKVIGILLIIGSLVMIYAFVQSIRRKNKIKIEHKKTANWSQQQREIIERRKK